MTKSVFLEHLHDKGFSLRPHGDHWIARHDQFIFRFALRQKAKSVWGRITKRWEYSIPNRDWQRFLTYEKLWIVVCDLQDGKVYGEAIALLHKHARLYSGDKLDQGGTMFFPKGKMRVLYGQT